MVVTLEPAALHLSHVRGVVAGVQRAEVVYYGEQRVAVVFEHAWNTSREKKIISWLPKTVFIFIDSSD